MDRCPPRSTISRVLVDPRGQPLSDEGSTLVGASLVSDLVERLDGYAAKREWTRAQAIREAVGLLLNAQ